jgi:RNA polymerase sigma-70 factor (ECF subfamily)
VIRGAAAGLRHDREEFARKYQPVVRAYLGARWRQSPLAAHVDDAIQDVLLVVMRKLDAVLVTL